MHLVIFGLSISSSWGNGHATLWRGLCKALARLGHSSVFFERDQPYYASHRDAHTFTSTQLMLYGSWANVRARARRELQRCDAAIITSYCPDALEAGLLLLEVPAPLTVFYDLDTPVTLAHLQAGRAVDYIGTQGLREFDLVLSYTGGPALEQLRSMLGARATGALYGHVDPDVHQRVPGCALYRSALSYLGTYAVDRQAAVEELLVQPAQAREAVQFLVAGAQYPPSVAWPSNVTRLDHVAPGEHAAFYCSSRLTLNITRAAMGSLGWCPSGRLFEAAACGTPIVSDHWRGLDEFYAPGEEILLAQDRDAVLAAMDHDDAQLARLGERARQRTLEEHTCHQRARTLIEMLYAASAGHRVRCEAAPVPATARICGASTRQTSLQSGS
jgi:spore maturation protein CgeB